jgi:hypothetical protein
MCRSKPTEWNLNVIETDQETGDDPNGDKRRNYACLTNREIESLYTTGWQKERVGCAGHQSATC